jgi:polysaccharide biosynthesis transport protein
VLKRFFSMNASPDATLHLDHWRITRGRVGLAISVFLLTLGAAAIFTYLTPKSYIASATVEVQTEKNQLPADQGSTAESTKDPNLHGGDLQAASSHDVLDPVIRRLNLQTKWSQNGAELSLESAYDKLRSMVLLEAVAPNFIRISAQGSSPRKATLLANSIAEEYVHQQTLQQQATVEEEADQVENAVRLKETTVSNLFAEVSRLRTAAGYADPNPDSSDTSLLPEESTTPTSQDKVNEIQANITKLKSRLDMLDRLKSDNLAETAGLLNFNDPVLEQKLPLYQNAVKEKARLLSSGLGHNHPDVRIIQGQIDAIEEQLRQEIANIRKGLSAQLAAAQNYLVTIETSLSANQPEQKRKEANAQYLEAKQRYDSAREAVATAKAKLNSLTSESAKVPKPVVISEPATTARRTGGSSDSLTLLVGAAIGLVLGVALAWLARSLDRSIKTPQEIEKRLGLPLLAIIPKHNRWIRWIDSDDPNDEPYQILKTNTQEARQKVAASVLAVVSGESGYGRSTTAAKLAMAYAASEQQTLVIDAALRRPAQHKLFGIDNRIGLSDCLGGETAFDEIIQDSGIPNLFVVTSGSSPGSPINLFGSPKYVELVEMAKEWFDVVIFDCPPILGADGSMAICGLVEGLIIVARHRRDPLTMVAKTKDALQNLGTKVLGVALTSAYLRRRPKKILPSVTVHVRSKDELAAEFQAATNRLRGDDAY